MVDEAGLTRVAARADVSHVRGRCCLARSRWSGAGATSPGLVHLRGFAWAHARADDFSDGRVAGCLSVSLSGCFAVPAVRPFRCGWSVFGTPPVALRDRAERAPRRTQHRQPRMAGVRARHRTRSRGSHALPALDPQAHAQRRAQQAFASGLAIGVAAAAEVEEEEEEQRLADDDGDEQRSRLREAD